MPSRGSFKVGKIPIFWPWIPSKLGFRWSAAGDPPEGGSYTLPWGTPHAAAKIRQDLTLRAFCACQNATLPRRVLHDRFPTLPQRVPKAELADSARKTAPPPDTSKSCLRKPDLRRVPRKGIFRGGMVASRMFGHRKNR